MSLRGAWLLAGLLWLGTLAGCSSEIVGPVGSCDMTLCGTACVDTQSNARHCGRCGTVCDPSSVCAAGVCALSCPSGQAVCAGACVNLQTDGAHCGACGTACPGGQVCNRGVCAYECGATLALCGAAMDGGMQGAYCADTQTDRRNCGACDTQCAGAEICRGGRCVGNCPEGQTACLGRCVDLQSDNTNCGTCRASCSVNFGCMAGRCRFLDCPAGTSFCGGRCADLRTDRDNCGTCGNPCPFGNLCVAGACVVACSASQTLCADRCVDTMTSGVHCGRCANACPAGNFCVAGACTPVCQTGQNLCAGRCVDTTTDRAHCGVCGGLCPGSQICAGGMCMATCPMGQTLCGATCLNVNVDPAHCGACSRACAGGEACALGLCRGFAMVDGGCSPPSLLCGSVCTNTRSDNNHCGACGRACSGDRLCSDGACVAPCPMGSDRCGASCTNLQIDETHCGTCPTACAMGQACIMGVCVTAPPTRYRRNDSPPETVAFIDACAAPGHATVLAGSDDGSAPSVLPFPMRFWATNLSAGAPVSVSSNGHILMNTTTGGASLSGTIPPGGANGMIAAHWTDDYQRTGICIATVGTAPNRQYVVEWNDIGYCCPAGPGTHLTFEIILNEGSSNIDMVFRTMTGARPAGVGLTDLRAPNLLNGCPAGTGGCAPAAGSRIRFQPIP